MTNRAKNIVFLCVGLIGLGVSIGGVIVRPDVLASGIFVGAISLVFVCSSLWGLAEKDDRKVG